MKKLILITALLISGSVFSQTKQEFGNWHYDSAEYDNYSGKEKVTKIYTDCSFKLLDYNGDAVLKVSFSNGKINMFYYVLEYENMEDGTLYMKLRSDLTGRIWKSFVGDKNATLASIDLNEQISFEVK